MRPAPPPGRVLNLDDIADALPEIDRWARSAAVALGYRPCGTTMFAASLNDYERLVGARARSGTGHIRGLCGSGSGLVRVVWVAPATLLDLFETVTHELAHAVLPLRANHTSDWLVVHIDTLVRVTSWPHAETIRRLCEAQYGL